MNTPLWIQVSTFNLDEPVSEYGFSTRLARENHWTTDFTQKAILEYKKFMYLAATAGQMVSPPPLVDTVWHLHLLFTESYADFCSLLGKQIQHIPSTHNRGEADKFQQAAERTTTLYNQEFGEQPQDVWACETMHDGLQLPRARLDIHRFVSRIVLAFLLLIAPFYFFLEPLYVHLNNPYFLIGYILLTVFALTILYIYNKTSLEKIVDGFEDAAFIRHLQPAELLYLRKGKLEVVIHGSVDKLVQENKVMVNHDHTLQLADHVVATSVEDITITEAIRTEKIIYPVLVRKLMHKPVFTNIAGSMEAFRDSFIQSKAFGKLFHLNAYILSLIFMLGLTRLLTGMVRHKPVVYITITMIVVLVIILVFLLNLTKLVCTGTIPDLYRTSILPAGRYTPGLDWRYFLLGTLVLSPQFVPLVNSYEGNDGSFSGFTSVDSSSGGCSGGCGSSCGSSCGGCGGGD